MRYRGVAGHAEGAAAISNSHITLMPDGIPIPNRNSSPEKIIMVGPCRVSIFRNLVWKDGQQIEIPKLVLEVRYKDRHGRWRGTPAISLRELPKAILALQKAFDYLTNNVPDKGPL